MKTLVLLLALLQSLGCSGIPSYYSELQSMANQGLETALAEINSMYAVNHLYRVTHGHVKRVIHMDLNTFDLLMMFGIKETECAKASGSDPQTCAFRPGYFVPSFSCSSRVRMSATSAQVVSLSCSHGGSSSSESSEEIFSKGRRQSSTPFANRGLAPPPESPPPVPHGHSLQRHRVEALPRGDTFSNFLV